jgi:hypothetical protein
MENENFELMIAQGVTRNLWRWNQYNHAYIDYINDDLTEESFDKLSEKFIEEPNKMTDEQLEKAIA